MSFFVLGLPRSRTAWLANFLSYDGQFCYHEGLNGVSSLDEYKSKIDGKGDSNTGLALFDFEPHFPNRKIVIIDSDLEKTIEFGERTYGNNLREAMTLLQERLNDIKGLHVPFDDINNRLSDIWSYVSDTEFDRERAEMLSKFNIQVTDPHDIDIEAIEKLKDSFHAFS